MNEPIDMLKAREEELLTHIQGVRKQLKALLNQWTELRNRKSEYWRTVAQSGRKVEVGG